jgi:curved DNA-binding protein CbpA
MSSDVHRRGGRDPHNVLGVPRGADQQHVMRAFRRKVKHGGHPDTGGDAQTFEEIVRARDVLLAQTRLAGYETDRRAAAKTPSANPGLSYSRPRTDSSPSETNRLAIVTAVLALLGPFWWPVAIVTGHLSLRQIKRTGQGGGTLVPIVLFFLYVLTFYLLTLAVLLPILSLIVIQ